MLRHRWMKMSWMIPVLLRGSSFEKKYLQSVLIRSSTVDNWAVPCDFQQYCILTCVDSCESEQPPFKLRISLWCLVSRLTFIKYSSDKQRLWCAYVQADLSLCWSHIPHCWKSHVLAHISILLYVYYYWWFIIDYILTHTSIYLFRKQVVDSVDICSYFGPLGILSSDRKQNTA